MPEPRFILTGPASPGSARHPSVLVSTDSSILGLLIMKVAHAAGCDQPAMSLGIDGVADRIRGERPDVLVLDIPVEAVDACPLIEAARDAGSRVVVLGWDMASELLCCGGGFDYLEKPIHAEDLLAELRLLMSKPIPVGSPGWPF